MWVKSGQDIATVWEKCKKTNQFLLLARYVPTVAKRSIWDQCKKKYILRTDQRPTGDQRPTTDRRPTNDLTFGKFQMAISPRGIVRSTSCLVLPRVFGVGESNGAISGFVKSKMATRPLSWKIQTAISPRQIVLFTPCLVLGWGFWGRRIERRDFRFRQIQDGGSAAILVNSNGDISVVDRPIYSVFGSRMGFSGSADRMARFPVPENSNSDISAADRPIYSVFGSKMGVFGVGGSNGAISGFAKSKMAARPPSWKIQTAISPRRIVRFTPCLVLRWVFRGRRIEWR